MENEVVIHVRVEDDSAAGLAKVKLAAKQAGEAIERDLAASGRKAGVALAAGIEDGLRRGRPGIIREADKIGDGVEREMREAGDRAGAGLGGGIAGGLDNAAPDVVSSSTTLGRDVEDELGQAGERAGRRLGEGIREGLRNGGGGEGGGDDRIIPDLDPPARRRGRQAGETIMESIGEVMSAAGNNPYVLGGAAAVGAALTPIIGATLGAAVIGAGAGLGIVGGFAASAKDPRVKTAFGGLKSMIQNDLKTATTGFVPDAVSAVGQVRNAWARVLPEVTNIFSKSGTLMGPLIEGVLGGVEALIDGIEDSLGNAGPVVSAFGDAFLEIGEALGNVFTQASGNSDALAAGLDFLVGAFVAAIDAIGIFIEVSAGIIDFFRPIGGLVADATNAINEWWWALGEAGGESEETSRQQEALAETTAATAAAIEEQKSALEALSDEMKKQTDPLYALISAQQEVEKAQTDYNKALDKHGPKSDEAKDALVKLGKAANNVAGAASDAAKNGLDVVTPAMRRAWSQAGLTKTQMNNLESALRGAKSAANNWNGTFKQTFITERIEKVSKQISRNRPDMAHGGITGAANGSTSSGMTMVGEYGPELVDLPPGTQVHSNPDTERMLGGAGFGGGMGGAGQSGPLEIILRFDPSHAPDAIKGMMEGIRAEVRAGTGSVQTELGVAGVAA